MSPSSEYEADQFRARAVDHARFLAELGLVQVLPQSILHKVIRQLLQLRSGGLQFATNMECLCQLLTVSGSALDSAQGEALMKQYFARIQRILEQRNSSLPNRLRFMLEDVVELWRNGWVPQHRGQRARLEEPKKREPRYFLGAGGKKDELSAAARMIAPLRSLHMDADCHSLFYRDSDSSLGLGLGRNAAVTPLLGAGGRGVSAGGGSGPAGDRARGSGTAEANGTRLAAAAGRRRAGGPEGGGSGRRKPSVPDLLASPPPGPPQQLMSASLSMDFSSCGAKQPLFSQLGGSGTTNWRQGGAANGGEGPSDGPPSNLPPRLRKAHGGTGGGGGGGGSAWQQLPLNAAPTPLLEPSRRLGGGGGARQSVGGISLYPGGSRQAASLSTAAGSSRGGRGALPANLFEPAYLQRPGTSLLTSASVKARAATGPGGHQVNGASHMGKSFNGTAGVSRNQEDVQERMEAVLEQCWGGEGCAPEMEGSLRALRDSRLLPAHGVDFVDGWLGRLLQRSDLRLASGLGLLSAMRLASLLRCDDVPRGLGCLLERLNEMEAASGARPVGLKSRLARILAGLLVAGRDGAPELLPLAALCELLKGGAHHPLFLLCLQQTAKGRQVLEEGATEDEEAAPWLLRLMEESGVELEMMLPAASRQSKERVWEVLEERGLSFLLPRVKVARYLQAYLPDELRTLAEEEEEEEPATIAVAGTKCRARNEEKAEEEEEEAEEKEETELTRWLSANFSPCLFHSPALVRALYAAATQRVWRLGQGGPGEGGCWAALSGRQRLTRERAWWRRLAEALKRQVVGPEAGLDRQVEAVHALQLVWHESGQPKDFLLRCFMNLYELEVLEEDAFLGWREQLNPAYPDKGRALFQVNQWLTWLEEAEEEDSTDEE